jgi:hypothetical protein
MERREVGGVPLVDRIVFERPRRPVVARIRMRRQRQHRPRECGVEVSVLSQPSVIMTKSRTAPAAGGTAAKRSLSSSPAFMMT